MGSTISSAVETYSKLGLNTLMLVLFGEPGILISLVVDVAPIVLSDYPVVPAIPIGDARFLVASLGDPAVFLLTLAVIGLALTLMSMDIGGAALVTLGDPIALMTLAGILLT
jgi:hypothetical protein